MEIAVRRIRKLSLNEVHDLIKLVCDDIKLQPHSGMTGVEVIDHVLEAADLVLEEPSQLPRRERPLRDHRCEFRDVLELDRVVLEVEGVAHLVEHRDQHHQPPESAMKARGQAKLVYTSLWRCI